MNSRKPEDVGYSVIPEVDYILSPNSILPIKYLLDSELLERISYQRNAFVTFCKIYDINVDCSSAFYKYCQYMKICVSNREKRGFVRTIQLMSIVLHKFHDDMIKPLPVVSFQVVKPIERFRIKVTIRPTHVAVQARLVQRTIKDSFVKFIASKDRPVIDVGGGNNSMLDSMVRLGLKFGKKIESVDRKLGLDMNSFDYNALTDEIVTFVHSSYHLKPDLFLKILRNHAVYGLMLVLDGDAGVIDTVGEDYSFRAIKYGNSGTYKVTGNIFGCKTVDIKGRIFKDEIWYSRHQLVQWGLKFMTFPSSDSELVRRHLVWFFKDTGTPIKIPSIEPLVVSLKEGSLTSINSKVPTIYRLFDQRPNLDKYCLYGLEHYQTDKADGINMKLMVDQRDLSLVLIDRFGMSFTVYDNNGDKYYFPRYYKFVLSVDLLMCETTIKYELPDYLSGHLPDSRFRIYFNQVIVSDSVCADPLFALEMNAYINLINGLFKRLLIGRKKYVLVTNFINNFSSSVPNDGVVYVPSLASGYLHSFIYGSAHMYIKPFSSTDTNPYILHQELIRLRPLSIKVWYRDNGKTVTDVNPMSDPLVRALNSPLYSTNAFHADVMLNPLLYEVLHFPAGTLDAESVLLITHVRGDKRKYSDKLALTNGDMVKPIIGLTKFGDNVEDMVQKFLMNLSDSRSIKMLPRFTGTVSTFFEKFMAEWKKDSDPIFYAKLNRNVDINRFYYGNVNDLLMTVRTLLPYNIALLFMELLFRFPIVKKDYNLVSGQVSLNIIVDLNHDYLIRDIIV